MALPANKKKIGCFINPWGNGHYSRMMVLHEAICKYLGQNHDLEFHYASKGEIYNKLTKRFSPDPNVKVHEVMIPTPIDGRYGPSVFNSLMNLLLPINDNPPLVKQIANYLRKEGGIYDNEMFDVVINDGDIGSNIIAERTGTPSVFVTNQFRPRLWKSHFYFYPPLLYVSKWMATANKIVVADSPPPYTICEYNLNFPQKVLDKVVYAGYFLPPSLSSPSSLPHNNNDEPKSDLEKLLQNSESEKFGYWMRTGNRATNEATGQKYEQVFQDQQMKNEKRIISHAKSDKSIDRVIDKKGNHYSITDALEKDIDWIQIDVGFLSEREKDTVLNRCKYAVINGSHTVIGEVLGLKQKPIIGIPVYDEHTNHIKWAEERKLGVLAENKKQILKAVNLIHGNYNKFRENLAEFSQNFDPNGAKNTADMINEIVEEGTKIPRKSYNF